MRKHKWTDIIFKIREYTKQEATLFDIYNVTQMVENESTLERQIVFASKSLMALSIVLSFSTLCVIC